MKDFVTNHFKSLLAFGGAGLTALTEWITEQSWIPNTVGLLTIIWTRCLIFGWFRRKGWRGKVDTGE